MNEPIRVAFVGNPNCGKTTLFNAVTGMKLKVANWPGVTVEKVEGETSYKDLSIRITDTPGIYSLTCYTIEEKVTRDCVMDDAIDVIVNVVDASNLERNLYLTLQLLELGKPIIVALNMMDVVEAEGLEIDLHRLPEMLGNTPVIPVSAAKRTGLDVLLHAVVHHYEEGPSKQAFLYNQIIEDKIAKLEVVMQAHYPSHGELRWHAIKLLEYDEEVMKEHPVYANNLIDRSYEKDIIKSKYDYIETIIEEVLVNKDKKTAFTDRVDQILTHPFWGLPCFLFIMACVFFLTFTVGDYLKGIFEILLSNLSESVNVFLLSLGAAPFLISLIVDGILAGVGGILTFLPNIFILFLALAFLEDSGYMARVAYVMDTVMGKVGLSGKAFLPMILGFGCTVPAIMATRALETEHDRKIVMLITPFMSCSAKLPIYVLFAGIFFPGHSMLVAFSLYVLGMITAIFIAFIMKRLEKGKANQSLLIELPEYKRPSARTIRIYVWEKIKDYLSKAGTTIFIASIVVWLILNYGPSGMVSDHSQSFAAYIGRLMIPVMKPAGMGMWQIVVALISGLSAKEVVVSSMAVLFGVANANSAHGMNQIAAGMKGFGPVNAYAFMVFSLFYTPCIATLAVIRKESKSFLFMIKIVIFQLVFAWLMAVAVYQGGTLLQSFLNR